jgi:hypothetical protein
MAASYVVLITFQDNIPKQHVDRATTYNQRKKQPAGKSTGCYGYVPACFHKSDVKPIIVVMTGNRQVYPPYADIKECKLASRKCWPLNQHALQPNLRNLKNKD